MTNAPVLVETGMLFFKLLMYLDVVRYCDIKTV